MKKSKLFIASVVVSCVLVSAPIIAGPGDKKIPEPVMEAQSNSPLTDWFLDLFDF